MSSKRIDLDRLTPQERRILESMIQEYRNNKYSPSFKKNDGTPNEGISAKAKDFLKKIFMINQKSKIH